MADTFAHLGGRLAAGILPGNGDVLTWDAALGAWKPGPGVPPAPAVRSWFDAMIDRGLARTGIDPTQAGLLLDDFTDLARWFVLDPNGTATCREKGNAGMCQLVMPAGAPGAGLSIVPGPANRPSATPAAGVVDLDGSWYMAGRINIVGMPPAPAPHWLRAFQTFGATGAYAALGAGTRPGGKFSAAFYDGINPANEYPSTVDYAEGAYHLFELWSRGGGNYGFAVDNEVPILVTPPNYGSGAATIQWYLDGLGGGCQSIIDKIAVVFPWAY